MADGFYGSITKYEKSAFKFDKIYPNRKAMAAGAATDGVFIGRYVLIDYDLIQTEGQEKPVDGSTLENNGNNNIDENTFILNDETNSLNSMRLLGANDDSQVFNLGLTDQYVENRSTDWNTYGNRDWDSTVWQKIYAIQNGEKVFAYRFIADLNTIKPAIKVLNAPASAENLTVPQLSSNEFYTIQIPDNWDFASGEITLPDREISEEDTDKGTVFNGKYAYLNNEGNTLELNSILNDKEYEKYYYTDEEGNIKEYEVEGETDITKDTKQLNIKLPLLTKAVSNMWDIVYGKIEQSEESAIYEKRNTDVAWDSYEGIRALKADGDRILFSKDNLSTLAGTINSVHDLMGMIIDDNDSNSLGNVKDWDEDKIYYIDGKFYAKTKVYKELTENAIEYSKNTYCYPSTEGQYFKNLENQNNQTFDINNVLFRVLINFSDLIFSDTTDDWTGKISIKLQLKTENNSNVDWDPRIDGELFMRISINGDSTYDTNIYNNNNNHVEISQEWETYEEITKELYLVKNNGNLEINPLNIDIIEDYPEIATIYSIDENLVLNKNNNNIDIDFLPYKYFVDKECTQPIYLENDFLNYNTIYSEDEEDYNNRWEARELVGLGRSLSTIHGIILQLYKILPNGDLNTQDTSTIQGTLNWLKNNLNSSLNAFRNNWNTLKNEKEEEWNLLKDNIENEWESKKEDYEEDYRDYQEHVQEIRRIDNSITNFQEILDNKIGSLNTAVDNNGVLKLSFVIVDSTSEG